MKVRRERPSDVPAIRTVVEVAFQSKTEAVLVDALRNGGHHVASVVAVENDAVLGHAMLSKMSGPFPMVALAPVCVAPAWQNKGLGSRLVACALDLAREDGWLAAFVLGAPAYYRRFGFSLDLARGFQSPYAGSHFMALALGGNLPSYAGMIEHAPPFAQLD